MIPDFVLFILNDYKRLKSESGPDGMIGMTIAVLENWSVGMAVRL